MAIVVAAVLKFCFSPPDLCSGAVAVVKLQSWLHREEQQKEEEGATEHCDRGAKPQPFLRAVLACTTTSDLIPGSGSSSKTFVTHLFSSLHLFPTSRITSSPVD